MADLHTDRDRQMPEGADFAVRIAQDVTELVEDRLAHGQCASEHAAEKLRALERDLRSHEWLSYAAMRSVLEAAVEALGGTEQLIDVIPLHQRSGRASDVTEILQRHGTPEALYRLMGAISANVVPLMAVSSRELAPREWEITLRAPDGYPALPGFCAWFSGQAIEGSHVFGYPPARVEETTCQLDGADMCRFHVSWDDVDPEIRARNMAELRAAGLEYRLHEFQDLVADVVAGDSISEVLKHIVRASLRSSLGSGCAIVVNPDALNAEHMLYAEGMEPETAAQLAQELCSDDPPEDPHRLVLDIRSGEHLLGYLVITDESASAFAGAGKLLETYARLAAAALSNARMVDQIRHNALHDPLTGAANRALISDRLEQMLARNRRSRTLVAVLFIDLDGFKQINDTLGHAAGDALLRGVTTRMRTAVRQADTIGRLGGDEFVVLLDGATMSVSPELVAERLLTVLAEPFDLGRGSTTPAAVTASIGIATGGETAGEMLRDADVALYRAKRDGKNRYVIFTPEMHTAAASRRQLELDLRVALDRRQFYLEYQPIFDLATGAVNAVEALLRWRHPDRGVVMPNEFVPVLEETGLIIEVGKWVLAEACAQAVRLSERGLALTVSVNVSIGQLKARHFDEHVQKALAVSGLNASSLILEITETELMHDVNAVVPQLERLRELGVRIAIDDFGNGYSSLAYLQQLPIDTLKIDRSFISAMSTSPDSATLVHTLVRLGKDLGLETLAEGIEESEQYAALQLEECDSGQGFMFAKPIPSDELAAFLSGQTSPAAPPAAG